MFAKLKNMFSNKKKEPNPFDSNNSTRFSSTSSNQKDYSQDSHDIVEYPIILDIAPNIFLVHKGARTCVGMDVLPNDITKRLSHIGKLVSRGHESILEHSNIISLITFDKSLTVDTLDYTELLSNARYCHVKVKETNKGIFVLIGGSIRAYINIIRETKPTNRYLDLIKYIMYNSIEKEFLTPLINKGLLDEDRCNYLPNAKGVDMGDEYTSILEDPKVIISDKADLLYATDVNKLYNQIKEYGFTMKDVCDVSIASLFFHDVSRSCANQMTRHRVGISQESQRYVTHDYDKDKDFINPIKLNLIDRYVDKDPELIKKIERIDPFETYRILMKDGFIKEDSRAWLPMNVTTKLMMTFTYSQLGHFLYLRSDKAAQKEIRMLTDSIKYVIKDKLPKLDENTKQYILSNRDKFGDCSGSDESIDMAALIFNGLLVYAVADGIYGYMKEEIEESPDEILSETVESVGNLPEQLDQNTLLDSLEEEKKDLTVGPSVDWSSNSNDSDWSSSDDGDFGGGD